MSLLHAGIDTASIALWLGHANIQTTQAAPEPEPEPTESRDDPDLDTGLNSDELLATYLGAQLIGEEDPEP